LPNRLCEFEVVTPDEYMGAVNGDLMRSADEIERTVASTGGAQGDHLFVPLSEMFGYYDDLRFSDPGTRDIDQCISNATTRRQRVLPKEVIAKVQGVASK